MNLPASALTLRLRDPRSAPQSQVRWERAGGSIGRGAACDWVLEADGVSRLHASVRCLDGLFFIEDHSTNGLLHNGAALRPGVPIALKHGDWLKIDVFEIEVAIGDEAAAGSALDDVSLHGAGFNQGGLHDGVPRNGAPNDHDHAFLPDVSISVMSAPQPGYVDEHDLHALLGSPQAAVAIDPLALLDGADHGASQWSMGAWNHTPAASAAYRSPPMLAAAPAPSVLPENWDLTRTQYAPEPEPAARPAAVAAQNMPAQSMLAQSMPAQNMPAQSEPVRGMPAYGLPESNTQPRPEPIARSEPAPMPAAPQAPLAIIGDEFAEPIDIVDARPAAPPLAAMPAATAPITARPPSPAEPSPPPARIDRAPVERAREPASPSRAAALLARTMAGVMDLLRARAEFKNGLRLPSTLVQRRENNPLKFAPSPEEAIERLLGPADGAYLNGEDAIDDAMRDIRHHQLALIGAMRIAMDNAFARFDPARFESEANAKSTLGQWSGKPWRQYREYYRTLREDPDERYRRLFGDEFARAYEEQMTHLKSSDSGAASPHGSGRS